MNLLYEQKTELEVSYEKEQKDKISYDKNDKVKMKNRLSSLNMILKVGEYFKLDNESIHLGMQYFDKFISIDDTKYFPLVAMVCLNIGNKFVARSKRIKIESFNEFVDFSHTDFVNLEMLILFKLDWDLNKITLSYYLNYFFNQYKSILNQNDLNMINRKGNLIPLNINLMSKYSKYQLALTLMYCIFINKSLRANNILLLKNYNQCIKDIFQTLSFNFNNIDKCINDLNISLEII